MVSNSLAGIPSFRDMIEVERERDLVAAAVPAATADCLVSVGGGIAMHDVEAEKSRSKEENGSQEEECEVSSEFVAGAASSNSGPVPDGATRIVIVSKQSEGDHSSDK